jgi:hypothetical protein
MTHNLLTMPVGNPGFHTATTAAILLRYQGHVKKTNRGRGKRRPYMK